MSEEIPTAPIIMRAYNLIRNKITPTQNIVFVTLESLVVGGSVSAFLYFYFGSSVILSSLPIISIVLVLLARFISIQPDKKLKEQYVMNVGFKSFLILTLVSVLPPIGYYYYFETLTQSLELIPIILSIYVISVYGRSRKYLGEREYYTDSYSNASQDWYMASVALEKAVSYADSNKGYRAYYWASEAQSLYEEIVETEERVALREAASALSAGCEFLSVSIFTQDSESYSYHSAAQESFERASEFFSQRVCDNCGRRKSIDQCQTMVRDEQKYVFCNTCREARKESSSREEGQRTKSSERRTQSSRQKSTTSSRDQQRSATSSGSNTNSRRQKTSSSGGRTSGNSTDNANDKGSSGMSKEEALNVLGVSEPISDSSEIHGAFRKNVKNSHPDTGGSEEEFKKVKEARQVLLDEI